MTTATRQQPATAAYLRRYLHCDLHVRIVIDADRDYSRADGDTRIGSGLPAMILAPHPNTGTLEVIGEAYNALQVEGWLIGDPRRMVAVPY